MCGPASNPSAVSVRAAKSPRSHAGEHSRALRSACSWAAATAAQESSRPPLAVAGEGGGAGAGGEIPYSAAASGDRQSARHTIWRTATRVRDMPREPSPPPSDRPRPAIATSTSALRARPPRLPPEPCSTPQRDVTYVPRHEGRITWDICPEFRHPPLRLPFDQSPG